VKKYFVLFGFLISVGVLIGFSEVFAKTVVIENGKDNLPMIIEKNDINMVTVPKIGDKECKGFKAGTYYITSGNSAAGVKIHKLELEPNGYIAVHEGPSVGEYVSYIITGEGELGLLNKEGKTVATYQWKAGDVIIFRPNIMKPITLHYWKNGPAKTEVIGVQQ
jgi:quercetin dioxygenase-like cupin family protein